MRQQRNPLALTSLPAPPYPHQLSLVGPSGAPLTTPPQNLTVATTGASGSLFLKQLLLAIERDDRIQTVNFIASDSALRVMAEELDIRPATFDTMAREFAYRVLAHIGLPQPDAYRWKA